MCFMAPDQELFCHSGETGKLVKVSKLCDKCNLHCGSLWITVEKADRADAALHYAEHWSEWGTDRCG